MATERTPRTRRLWADLFAPVDIASLCAFRMAFGVLALVLVGRYFAHGWIDDFYVRPTVFFPYDDLEWIRPWPRTWMYAHFAVLGIAASGILVGRYTRTCAAIFCLGFTYVHLIDRTNYLNHYYLVSLLSFLLILVPSGAAASLDARRGRLSLRWTPAWTVWVLRFQLGAVYFFAGLAKLDSDWLVAAQPMRAWLAARAEMPVLGPVLALDVTAHLFSLAGALFDLTAPFLLLIPAFRLPAYGAVLVFHALTALLFPSIGLFPWLMVALTPIFFPPDWPRRLRHLSPRMSHPLTWPLPAGEEFSRVLVTAALAVYVAIQIAVPLRHLAYPGDVLWTEQGFRFSWRVMLMEKYGRAEFLVRDAASGREWRVDPADHLTPLQVHMMSTQPDMIAFYGRWLGERLRTEGYPQIEVRADVQISLNGRPHAALIDGNVDLASDAGSLERLVLAPR